MDMQSALSGKTAQDRATDLLREDHRTVRELLTQYERAMAEQWDTRQGIAEEICMQLEAHARVEEEIFYPAIARVDASFIAHAREQHEAMNEQIQRVKQPSVDIVQYDAAMRELNRLFDPHILEEEQLFALLERRVPEALYRLRAKIVRCKEQLTGSTQEMQGRS
jgi:hemerythrin HHE cation binding domain-containing protein